MLVYNENHLVIATGIGTFRDGFNHIERSHASIGVRDAGPAEQVVVSRPSECGFWCEGFEGRGDDGSLRRRDSGRIEARHKGKTLKHDCT